MQAKQTIEHIGQLLELAFVLATELDQSQLTQSAQREHIKMAASIEDARNMSEDLEKMGDLNLLVREHEKI